MNAAEKEGDPCVESRSLAEVAGAVIGLDDPNSFSCFFHGKTVETPGGSGMTKGGFGGLK
jgi:hypothetical protein